MAAAAAASKPSRESWGESREEEMDFGFSPFTKEKRTPQEMDKQIAFEIELQAAQSQAARQAAARRLQGEKQGGRPAANVDRVRSGMA